MESSDIIECLRMDGSPVSGEACRKHTWKAGEKIVDVLIALLCIFIGADKVLDEWRTTNTISLCKWKSRDV